MDTIILVVGIVVLCVQLLILVQVSKKNKQGADDRQTTDIGRIQTALEDNNRVFRKEMTESVQSSLKNLGDILAENQKNAAETQSKSIQTIGETLKKQNEGMEKEIHARLDHFNDVQTKMPETMQSSLQTLGEMISENQKVFLENQKTFASQQNQAVSEAGTKTTTQLQTIGDSITKQLGEMQSAVERRLQTSALESENKLDSIRKTVENKLQYIQQDNNKKLDEMRQVVDEKLQKTLEDRISKSFSLVSERLEQVYKGLGEMQNLASGVGDLKKVLSNVKTRGILGEIQLGAILEEILAPEQYETNYVTKKGSREPVEYAIKLPTEDGQGIYLPIDSKFPGDAYLHLMDAYESGDREAVKEAAKVLTTRIKAFAKDIHDKYIDPPYTTDFAIMFLPFEGLYAEVVNRGMVEELQRLYHVNVAGPSTMAALLNSLQMGFRTFAIQKRSGEVWKVLGAVKTEFETFGKVLEKAQTRIQNANDELDKLIGVRTRQIQRKLKDVERLDADLSQKILSVSEWEMDEKE